MLKPKRKRRINTTPHMSYSHYLLGIPTKMRRISKDLLFRCILSALLCCIVLFFLNDNNPTMQLPSATITTTTKFRQPKQTATVKPLWPWWQRMVPPERSFGRGGGGGSNTSSAEDMYDPQLVMKDRQNRITKKCMNLREKTYEEKEYWNNFLVVPSYKLIYCMNPKAASTTWKILISELSGFVNSSDKVVNNSDDFWDLWIGKFFRKIKKMSDYSEIERKDILNSYHMTTVTRHPFERLTSAFRDKFSRVMYQQGVGKTIIRRYRKDATAMDIKKGGVVYFQEFVQFVLDEARNKKSLDYHWERQHIMCTPCLVPYDLLSHYETINHDIDQVLKTIGAPGHVGFRKQTKSYSKGPSSADLVRTLFQNLTLKQVDQLYETYKLDFDLFSF